jgi:hypothetical protein
VVATTPNRIVTTAAGGVLHVDLENMVGQMAKPGIVTARMRALIRCAGPGVAVVAACVRTRITQAGAEGSPGHHVSLVTVDGSKDAADEALLAEAQRRADDGCRRFVVASNDSTFVSVAHLGDLEIVIWAPEKPRKNYTARASRTHHLPIPAASATSHSTTPAKGPAAFPTQAGTATKIHPPVTPKNAAIFSANAAKPATASRQRHPHQQPSAETHRALQHHGCGP